MTSFDQQQSQHVQHLDHQEREAAIAALVEAAESLLTRRNMIFVSPDDIKNLADALAEYRRLGP